MVAEVVKKIERVKHTSFQKWLTPWLNVAMTHSTPKLDPTPSIIWPYLPTSAIRPGISFFLLGTRFNSRFNARTLNVTGQDVMVCIWGAKAQNSEEIADAILNYALEWHPDDYVDRNITNICTIPRPLPLDEEPPVIVADMEAFWAAREIFWNGIKDCIKETKRRTEDGAEIPKHLTQKELDEFDICDTIPKVNPGEGRPVTFREQLGYLQALWDMLDDDDMDLRHYPGEITEEYKTIEGYVGMRLPAEKVIDSLEELKNALPHLPIGIEPRNMFDMLRPGLPDLGVYERIVMLNIVKTV